MGKIIILDENTANKIAAGEVIERPASVIKELVENSIDAGATVIQVEIRNGGISFIRVIDNGGGIADDDVEIAFERHATSKIRRADDLESISSMGFRGEALASIAAVSAVQLSTRVKSAIQGTGIEVKGGSVINVKPIGCPVGTTITVKELFFNTPARYKFLKKDSTEAGYVADVLSRLSLGYPDISFKLVSNGAVLLHTPGNGDLKSAIFSVYGAEVSKQLIEINYDDTRVKIYGYVGKAELSRSSRNQQSFYINRRYIRSKTITAALDAAYETFLMKNKYAFALLDIRLNPALTDVNVHPSKMEVKFSSEQDIYRAVYHAVNSALLSQTSIRTVSANSKEDRKVYNFVDRTVEKPAFTQQSFEWVKKELDQKRADAIAGKLDNKAIAISENNRMAANPEDNSDMQNAVHEVSTAIADNKENKCVSPGNPTKEASAGTGVVSESKMEYENRKNESTAEPADAHKAAAASGQKTSNKNLFEGTRLIGQAFSTYILLERDDELLLLDQHAAHERIRYEELKAAYERNEPVSQTLISVIPIELTAGECQFALSESPFFEKLGFTYESFGVNSIILRSAPFDDNGLNARELFLNTLDFVINESNAHKNASADELLYTMACKSAVKAHKKLDEREIEALLQKLSELENPYTCPHGRPAILRVKRYELEKLFKRIV